MKKIICSPGSYIQGSNEIDNLAEYYGQLGSSGAYLIVDKFIFDTYQDAIRGSFVRGNVPYAIHVFGGECSHAEIDAHQRQLEDADVIIGIGGGKTLDTAKSVAFYSHLPMIIVPTAASTDAPCSRLAVIYKETHEFEEYLPLTSNPNMVIMDTNIIAHAPARFLMAGIGDAFATYYEAAACEKSNAVTMTGGHVTKAAMALAKLCRDTIVAEGLLAKAAVESHVSTAAVEDVVEANTYLSGVGFESGGLAAAHAIHNGLTVLEETHRLLHGEKVAFGTITQLVLENRPLEEITAAIRFCRACGLPVSLSDLNLDQASDEHLMEAAAASCAANDTMGNMPFKVEPQDVFAAMKTADAISRGIAAE